MTGRVSKVCFGLPPGFTWRDSASGATTFFTPNGAPVTARAEVCLQDGRCRTWESWHLVFRGGGRNRFCLSETRPPRDGSIVSVRIDANEAMRADGVWLVSYDPR
jgi:hypothetical protein